MKPEQIRNILIFTALKVGTLVLIRKALIQGMKK